MACAVAVLATLAYVIAPLVGSCYAIYVAPVRFHEVTFRQRFKFLLIRFRGSSWWWSVVIMVKMIALNFSRVVTQEGSLQLQCSLVTLLCYSVLLALQLP